MNIEDAQDYRRLAEQFKEEADDYERHAARLRVRASELLEQAQELEQIQPGKPVERYPVTSAYPEPAWYFDVMPGGKR